MTKRVLLSLCLFLLLSVSMPTLAQQMPEATVDLADDFVPVTGDFDGARMTVFGALQSAKSDIVVVFEGPAAKALVRAKVRQMGIWVNGEPETLEPVASYYAVLSSRPLVEILSKEAREKLGLGLDVLELKGEAGNGFKADRIKRGLYVESAGTVKVRDKKLFRADVDLPPNVPVGAYHARIYEVNGGTVKANSTTNFTVAQVGMGSFIKTLSHDHPALYALMSLSLVLGLGGSAAYLFRRIS